MGKKHQKPDWNENVRAKFASWALIVVMLLAFWFMMDFVLLTFIITFVFYQLLRVSQKGLRRIRLRLPDGAVLPFLYAAVLGVLSYLGTILMPKLVDQIIDIGKMLMHFDISALRDIMSDRLYYWLLELDYQTYLTKAGELLIQGIGSIGAFGIYVLLALVLSFLLLLEKGKIYHFGEHLKLSRISFVYGYLMNFGGNFVKTFGQVMKVQVTIAFINCILSMIMLTIMKFPSVLGLGLMIFVLGLVPVAGVVISLIPLCIIGFNSGGIMKVVGVLVMIIILHAIEAYILNPKLMSNRTQLPVCLVFIILVTSEHYLGVWGLLIGVPLFMFLMDIFAVDYSSGNPEKKRRRLRKKLLGTGWEDVDTGDLDVEDGGEEVPGDAGSDDEGSGIDVGSDGDVAGGSGRKHGSDPDRRVQMDVLPQENRSDASAEKGTPERTDPILSRNTRQFSSEELEQIRKAAQKMHK